MESVRTNVIPLDSIWDKKKLLKVQDKFCKTCNIYAYLVDESGNQITDFSGSEEDVGKISRTFSRDTFNEVFSRVSGNSLEDQVVEDTVFGNIRIAAIRIGSTKMAEMTWIVLASLNDVTTLDDKKMLTGLTRTLSEEELYQTLDLIRVISRSLLEAKSLAAEASLKSVISQNDKENMSNEIKRTAALTEVVQLLDSDDPIETIFGKALGLAGEYLGVSSAQVFNMNRDGVTMDVVAEWCKNGLSSIFGKTRNIEKSPLLYGDKAVVVSSTTAVNGNERKLMEEGHILARASFPIMINGKPGMYAFFAECKRERIFTVDEVRFMGDVVQVMESVIVRRIQKNSLVGSYASLEAILDNVGSSIYVQDKTTGRILFANKMLKLTFGAYLEKGTLSSLFCEGDDGDSGHREIFCKDNSKFYDLYTTTISWVDGSPAVLYAAYDVTEKRLYQQKIEQQAYTDFLTGLYNRMCCERDLAVQVDYAKKHDRRGAILYIDLDDFKHINDGLGHQYGDVLLQTIAKSVKRVSGIHDSFYRMGGDEFVIIITVDAYSKINNIIEEVKTIFSKPWFLKNADYYCTMSMGVVEFPEAGDSVHDLIKKADVAMYEAKKGGKNRVVYYSDQLSDESNMRLDMEKNMRDATGSGYREFEVYYQPIVDIQKPGYPCTGAEALIRWNSKELGFVTPDVFIPLAEYLGLINPIGNFVLREACRTLKNWNENGYPGYKVNVNLSVVQLLQNDIVEIVRDVIEETGINPHNLTLEVTESLAINDMRRMKRILSSIKALGVRIALDDFGTGYSSLNRVRELPLDVIKVDQSFVRDLSSDSYSQAFVKMVAELAETIGLSVCVEGIEREDQFACMKDMKVRMIQGYYFGRPMALPDFEAKFVPELEENMRKKVIENAVRA